MDRSGAAPSSERRDALGPRPPLVVVVKGYPRVSETFVAQELAALERRGFALAIVSLRRPYDRITQPVHAEVRAPVLYLPEYLIEDPRRVLRGHLQAFRRAPGRYLRSLRLWLSDLARDPTPNRGRRFGQAGVLAAELWPEARHMHVHFLHTPASVARYAAAMAGLTYSLSAHAKDIWTRPAWELRAKLAGARFCVTCTAENREYLRRLMPQARVDLVYHGLDRAFFAPPATFGSPRDGRDANDPVRLLAVGRLQPKKGFDLVLRALARLPGHAVLTLVGYGPAESSLRSLTSALGLEARVRWLGQLDHPAVRALYRTSDLFVLAPRVAADGDRDGLPNVVVEALSQGLPVVATRAAAVGEIVEDGLNGVLVPPEDPAALASALARLAADPATRRRLGAAGIRRVAEGWDLEAGVGRLTALLSPWLEDAPVRSTRVPVP
ncbi:MAG TPA: glycosyltransferase [Methylomirabilota bacterium]|nr:glycosyltransferase [Methylomirabilota bacterium]